VSARKKVKAGTSKRRKRQPNRPLRGVARSGVRVVGLDVSSVCVGYAVFDDDELVAYGKYHQLGEEHGEKMVAFQGWLTTLLKEFTPDCFVVEQPYPGQRRHTYGVLSMYVGLVLMAHWAHYRAEMPKKHRVPAHRVKRLLGVPKGQTHAENKEIMVAEINRRYGTGLRYRRTDTSRHSTDDDVADAIALVAAWREINRTDA
jgi:Holliday junction resolvasome RuvABC endonuclease subunit